MIRIGLEPMTFPLYKRDALFKYIIKELSCDPDWIRTNDLLLRRQLLYPTELPDLLKCRKDKGMGNIFIRGI
jgi:hypothetical protein